jgi:GcrA cell cycle regulator
MTAFVWPPEAVARLRELRQAGIAFSECTRALNAEFGATLSRNAVIGKAQRIGLCQPSASSPRAMRIMVRARPSVDVITVASKPVAVCNARPHHCRWPLGDPKSPDFRFCGARRLEPLPYCPDHALIAYQPASKRKGRAA